MALLHGCIWNSESCAQMPHDNITKGCRLMLDYWLPRLNRDLGNYLCTIWFIFELSKWQCVFQGLEILNSQNILIHCQVGRTALFAFGASKQASYYFHRACQTLPSRHFAGPKVAVTSAVLRCLIWTTAGELGWDHVMGCSICMALEWFWIALVLTWIHGGWIKRWLYSQRTWVGKGASRKQHSSWHDRYNGFAGAVDWMKNSLWKSDIT